MKLDVSAKEAAGILRRRWSRENKRAIPARVNHVTAKPDRGREREPGFLAYLRRQPCEAAHLGGCEGPIQACHVRFADAARRIVNPGLQRKNHDRHATPACAAHHALQHSMNERAYWALLGKDAYDTAAAHHAAYLGEALQSRGFAPSRGRGA